MRRKTTSVGPVYPKLKPKNEEQRIYAELIRDNNITFCFGGAGSGKTHVAGGMAASFLNNGWVKKIILTRPQVASENSGREPFLPGNKDQKIEPYLDPILTELSYFLPVERLVEQKKIIFAPLGYMRGSTMKDCFVIVEEAQNIERKLFKLLCTRFGDNCKMVISGDVTQSDLNGGNKNPFLDFVDKVIRPLVECEENGIAVINLLECVRHPLVKVICDQYEKVYGV